MSARFLNEGKRGLDVSVALLIPEDDHHLEKLYKDRRDLSLFMGSEDDVLSRYAKYAEQTKADYMVRITSDCPFIAPRTISKHITFAAQYKWDYISNVDEMARMAPDGDDCEVMSAKMLKWVDEIASDKADREHVTTYIRKMRPKWARIAGVGYDRDYSQLKISVDTEEDLEYVRSYQWASRRKIEILKDRNNFDGFHII